MANYGDVSLRLPADWSRARLLNQEHGLLIVGHEDGLADARLAEDKDKKHQFRWVDPANKPEIDMAKLNHYDFVNVNNGWEKNESIWSVLADGRIECMGNHLMARDGKYWAEEQRKKEDNDAAKSVRREDSAVARMAEAQDIEVFDEDSRPLKARRKR